MSSMRHTLLAGVAALALLPTGSLLADAPAPRTVSVTGQGEVSAQPDLAYVTLGVEARRPTMAEARTQVAQTVDKVLALTRELKIDPKLVNATRVQVQPEYNWNDQTRKRVLLGYVVSRQIQVEVRDLDQLGPLIERAVTAGVNQVNDPVLDSTKRKQLERQAMTLAVEDARQNAETLATAAFVKLGPVRSINGGGSPPVVPMYRARMVMADAAAPPPPEAAYEPGDMKFSASVSAEYDLLMGP